MCRLRAHCVGDTLPGGLHALAHVTFTTSTSAKGNHYPAYRRANCEGRLRWLSWSQRRRVSEPGLQSRRPSSDLRPRTRHAAPPCSEEEETEVREAAEVSKVAGAGTGRVGFEAPARELGPGTGPRAGLRSRLRPAARTLYARGPGPPGASHEPSARCC